MSLSTQTTMPREERDNEQNEKAHNNFPTTMGLNKNETPQNLHAFRSHARLCPL